MLSYLFTSAWLVFLVLFFSLGESSFRVLKKNWVPKVGNIPPLPTLFLGTGLVLSFYYFFGINLVFGVSLDWGMKEVLLYSILPALVLYCGSGVRGNLLCELDKEQKYWRTKPFFRSQQSVGIDPEKKLLPLVLYKSLITTWQKSLIWVFSELVVIESIFNVQGIGLHCFEMAKVQNLEILGEDLLFLLLFYSAVSLLFYRLSHNLSKRLSDYV